MNKQIPRFNSELLNYQTVRLQDLIGEIIHCCEDRKLYESTRFGLPYTELKCLMLFEGERYLTVKGISEKLDVAKSRVTKVIEGLMKKGLIETMVDPKDARVKLINRTTAGQKKSQEVEGFQREIHRKLLLQMDGEERKSVLSHLEVLRAAMEAVKEGLR